MAGIDFSAVSRRTTAIPIWLLSRVLTGPSTTMTRWHLAGVDFLADVSLKLLVPITFDPLTAAKPIPGFMVGVLCFSYISVLISACGHVFLLFIVRFTVSGCAKDYS